MSGWSADTVNQSRLRRMRLMAQFHAGFRYSIVRYPPMAAPEDKTNHYDVLLVSRNAPVEIIRASYRTLMQRLKMHPDLGGDTETAAQINEAYAVLTDEQRRAEYDAYLHALDQAGRGIDFEPAGAAQGSEQDDSPEEPHEPEHSAQPGPAESAERPQPAAAGAQTTRRDPSRGCVFCGTTHEHGKAIDVDAACTVCGSPLCPADNQRLELSGQRAVSRIGKTHDISYFASWPQAQGIAGRSEDLSLNGMRFTTRGTLVEGQFIKIASDVLEAVAVVTNCSRRRNGMFMNSIVGVAFVTLRFGRSVGGFVSERI